MRPIRTAAKAIIIRNGSILVQENLDDEGPWFLIPGGGQEPGESLHAALQRECVEEIGTKVEIGELRFVRDYIAEHHEFAAFEPDVHQIELMFACAVPDNYEPAKGHTPDTRQIGVCWLPLQELPRHRFYPRALVPHLLDAAESANGVIYLGDVN